MYFWPILGPYNNWHIIHCIEGRKKHRILDTNINVHIKQHAISNIALNIGKHISDNDYGSISTIDKNVGNSYYLVKCTGDSYTFQSSYKIR